MKNVFIRSNFKVLLYFLSLQKFSNSQFTTENIHLNDHHFSVFCMKKKLFGGFTPMSLPRHCPGPPVGLTAPPDPSCNCFWLCQKLMHPYFFLIYPLTLWIKQLDRPIVFFFLGIIIPED